MSAAERLREAARVLRERAQAATPGPWIDSLGGDILTQVAPGVVASCGRASWKNDAAFISSMSPVLALALADYLDAEATHHDRWQEAKREVVTTMLAFEGSTVSEALAVADAILGDKS